MNGISTARKSSADNPPDRERVHPLKIKRPQVLDPDPEVIEDPPICRTFSVSGSQVAELVQQQAEEIPLRNVTRQRDAADRVRMVEGMHQTTFARNAGGHFPEQNDLPASDVKFRPSQGWLRPGGKSPDELEGKLKASSWGTPTG